MPVAHEPVLLNTVAHAAGALIFAIFIALLLRQYGWSALRRAGLSVAAASLAVLWNAGSILALAFPAAPPWQAALIAASSFSALSLLPAVLFHISLGRRYRALVVAGYVLGAAALAIHCGEIVRPVAGLHRAGLAVITGGFLVLTLFAAAAMAIGGRRGRATPSRLLATMCLALFSLSFAHFHGGGEHVGSTGELFFHHAGIPLALFILLQDYRFVLLDAFVRFLANVLLAALATFVVLQAALRLAPVEEGANPLPQALLLVGLCAVLVAFAVLRNALQAWLGRVVFRRPDPELLAHALHSHPGIANESGYLPWAAAEVARAMKAERHEIAPGDATSPRPDWAEAAAPLRFVKGEPRQLLLGSRRGGRRYLSEDLEMLKRAAGCIAEVVEDFRAQEMQELVHQAELRALQAQINPHFLFNALNTVYGAIPRDASAARATVLNLSEIFRYLLQSEGALIALAEEVRIIRAYLEIEKLRLGARLQAEIDVDGSAGRALIPILSVQPLVENAVKHGVASRSGPGRVRLSARAAAGALTISVENSPAARDAAAAQQAGFGVGLANVRRRLQLCFGTGADLAIRYEDARTVVEFSVPLDRRTVEAGA